MTARAGRWVAALVVIGLVGAAYVAWHWYALNRTVPADSTLATQCDQVPESARRITLTGADGRELGGALVGSPDATVGLVLRQGASQTICEWLPEAAELADRAKAQVLLFDRRGFGSSPGVKDLTAEPDDLQAAVRRIRDEGADRVVLIASSMGNSVMFAALPDLSPAPCAVVSVSPVLTSSDSRGSVDGASLTGLPDNLWVTWEEGNPGIADTARRVATVVPGAHTLSVDTSHHSIALVTQHTEVRDFLADAAGSCA